MPIPRDLLASDAERERVAETLRTHAADGRLDHDELDDRLGSAYGARTRGELAPLVADLPPAPQPRPEPQPRWRQLPQLGPVIALSILLVAIWAATGMGYFWPIWPIGALLFSSLKPGGGCVPFSRHLRAP